MADGIRVETDSRGVATVTLDRPEVSNAFDTAMLRALLAAFDGFAHDDAVRAVMLRGAGKHFSAGADLKAAAPAHGREEIDPVAVLNLIDRCPKPTVALVQGACIGGGVAWIAACDIAIAEEGAFFSIPEVRIGFCPSPMIPLFLAAMGARALRRYALTGERFGTAEALRCGLIHEVCAAGSLDQAAAPVVDGLLHGAPKAAAAIKRVIAGCEADSSEADAVALAADFHAQRNSPEAEEGRAAFREKRKPAWYRGRR
jgi:methylglutaconyl-CoA hydratase